MVPLVVRSTFHSLIAVECISQKYWSNAMNRNEKLLFTRFIKCFFFDDFLIFCLSSGSFDICSRIIHTAKHITTYWPLMRVAHCVCAFDQSIAIFDSWIQSIYVNICLPRIVYFMYKINERLELVFFIGLFQVDRIYERESIVIGYKNVYSLLIFCSLEIHWNEPYFWDIFCLFYSKFIY